MESAVCTAVTSTDVVFEESIFPLKHQEQPQHASEHLHAPQPSLVNLVLPDSDDEDEGAPLTPAPEPPPALSPPTFQIPPSTSQSQLPHPPLPPAAPAPRRSHRILRQRPLSDSPNASPDKVQRWVPAITVFNNSISAYLAVVHVTPTGDPNTYEYALSTPDGPWWELAMEDEMMCLNDNGTWVLVDLPKDRMPIKCKWVFLTKRDTEGDEIRLRARLVAKGFSQTEGIDYDETFAPVARLDSLCMLLAIAAHFDLEVHHIDIKSAYLNGNLDEEIYMEQPKGFVVKGKENQVCLLKKALYGLKQAGRQWHVHLNDTLKEFGFRRIISADTSIFIEDGGDLILLVYIDDIALFGTLTKINMFKERIVKRYKITDLGEIGQFLGLHIIRNRPKRTLSIGQQHYVQHMLTRFKMLDCAPVFTPFTAGTKLQANPDDTPDPQLRMRYQQVVGSLMYAMLGSRPDICFAVNKLAQYGSNPSHTHLNSALHVLRYLRSTKDHCLTYGRNDCSELIAHSDSDWGADKDTRRSVTGYCFMFTGTAISWAARKQRTVALSSTEAEYMAVAACAKHAKWTISLLEQLEFDVELPIDIFLDSDGAKAIAENPRHNDRTKHINIQHHYIQEHVSDGTLAVLPVDSDDNTADVFTKSFPCNRHEFLTEKLGLVGSSNHGGVL